VCQINKVDHTDAGAQGRLQNQPIFGGTSPKGKCLICDDVVTYGATLANLRGFLISTGAEVLAATAIGAAYGSTKLAPEPSLIVKLRKRYGEKLRKMHRNPRLRKRLPHGPGSPFSRRNADH